MLAMALMWPAAATGTPPDAGQSLLLDVVVNGQDHNNIQEIAQRQGALLFTREQLTASGLVLHGKPAETGDGLISLDSIKEWTWRLDANAQTLYLKVPVQNQIAQQLNADPGSADLSPAHSDTGALLNYDTEFTHYAGQTGNSLLGELRLFGNRGVLSNNALETHNPYLSQTVRLDSTYSVSDVATLRTWNVGDYINGGLDWTRPVRMAGMQMTTNFGLRPDLVTFARPGISGEVAVPSSVDIYVNGLHQMTTQVDPGPFEINQLPVTSGGGDVSMVVKDANGRQTNETLPFYASSNLLQKGLDSLSVEAGSVRRAYASRSDDYAGGAASMSYRHGATDRLTLETHLEGSEKVAMGGVGADMLVGSLGVLSGSLAVGGYGQTPGTQYGVGFVHNVHAFSYGASLLKADSHFYDLASAYGDGTPGTTLRANVGFPLPGGGSFGVVYAKRLVNYYNDYNYESTRIETSTLTATYSSSLPFLRAFGYVTALHDFDYDHDNAVFVGISLPIGHRATASAGGSVSNGESYQTLQAQQSAVQRGDIGWSLGEQNGSISRQTAGLEYKSDWGLMGAQAEQGTAGQAQRGTLQGALVAMDGHVFAANTIQDGFAVVDTDGLPGVEVMQENRPVGKTDKNGLLFVEDLRAYESNRLSINPNDVPMDVSLENDNLTVKPNDRSGVLAKFPIHHTNGATLRLVDSQHVPLPLGSVATLVSGGAQAMVGYDGVTYFENLAEHNRLKVATPGRPDCGLTFDYRPQTGAIPEIGPLICITGA
ncbi:fimbria/pilus outer membrane usher protein [Sodalis sp. RH16]|uniref:fimbria/pilus outer membrane usher protein n=1 Tax=Sodalis sp. RH16 TaxID=3394331 RepID=UPI0039B41393